MARGANWISWTGAGVSLLGAAATIIVAWINYTATKETAKATIEAATVAQETELIKLAAAMVQNPQIPASIRAWAAEVLATWKKVPLSPEQKKGIAEAWQKAPEKTLQEVGKDIPAITQLSAKLEADPLVKDIFSVPDIFEPEDMFLPAPKGDQEPGTLVPLPKEGDAQQPELRPGTGKIETWQ